MNALVCLHFEELFGRSKVFQLPQVELEDEATSGEAAKDESPPGGRRLFRKGLNYEELSDFYAEGARIRRTVFTEAFDFDDFQALHGDRAVPLVLLQSTNEVIPWVAGTSPRPKPGDTLVSLVAESDRGPENGTAVNPPPSVTDQGDLPG